MKKRIKFSLLAMTVVVLLLSNLGLAVGTWTEGSKIQSSDIEAGDKFGWSVSISEDGNTAIVGAYLDDDGGADSGSAYIFNFDPTVYAAPGAGVIALLALATGAAATGLVLIRRRMKMRRA